ncbi:MAG: hypothetical protein HY906_03950 [Deltaproteobacteria bacterium]|nr:hypothetical protein [Deltaproteobacteria bacterium]
MDESNEELVLDLGGALGADETTSVQRLTLYIHDKDKDGVEFGTQRRWVLEAAKLLTQMGGGATIMPPVEGTWLNKSTATVVWERPVLVYTFVQPDPFVGLLPDLRKFVRRLGRETNQGEVVVEFDGNLIRVTDFQEEIP